MQTQEQLIDTDDVLETARNLDRLGRRVERYLSMQLQHLEMAVARFDRERAAWKRQRQSELEHLEQSRRELEAAWEQLRAARQRRGDGNSGERGKRLHRPVSDAPPSSSPTTPSEAPAAGTGSAPLKLLLDPGTAGEQWLGGLLLEFSKLNRELGGSGVRFELSRCRHPRTSPPSDAKEDGFQDLLLELELFSHQPLLPVKSDAETTGPSADLLNWERFKSAMLLTPLVDRTLSKEFDRCRETPRDHPGKERVIKLLQQVNEANVRVVASPPPLAWTGPASQAGQQHDHSDEAVRKQLRRVETVASVIANDCGLRLHVCLI
jgi:hypothetical protein